MSGVLVVGAGLAGSRCAEALRAGGYERPVTVVGAEPFAPYERPALSKELLAGARDPDCLLLRPAGWWDERGIDLRLGAAVEVVDVDRRVALVGGREIRWDELVLATGARARRLPLESAEGIHVLRTLEDAVRLRASLRPGRRLVVVGAGFVGAEVASTALELGVDVTILEAAPAPLERAAGHEVGRLLAKRWREEGASVRLGARIERIGRRRVHLSGAEVVPFDCLLIAVGAAPADELLGGTVTTDACGRTSAPGVYACGDVAAFGGRRVEHWTSAAGQATAVASAILGEAHPYVDLPYFWSDQFGLRLQMVGSTDGWTRVELEGHPASFRARYADDEGRTIAVLLANRPREIGAARRELAEAA